VVHSATINSLNALFWIAMLGIEFHGMRNATILTGEFVTALYITQRLLGNARAFIDRAGHLLTFIGQPECGFSWIGAFIELRKIEEPAV
jgi:ATP-binding cassette subfamily B multidrug efflux pump